METPLDKIFNEMAGIYDDVRISSGIIIGFSREDRRKHQNSHTFYLAYEGPLPTTSAKEVKVDITINEQIVMPLQKRTMLKGYDEYIDLPEDTSILVYSLDEILVEKLVALTDRARNEPRDLYDVWYLTAEENMDLTALIPGIESKLEFRGRALAGIGEEFAKKETRLKKLWQARLSNQMAFLPHFDEVYRSVQRCLRIAGLMKR